MSEPSTPQDLPPAYMPPAYIASPSAVDQPALGLVLALAALLSLPQPAMMLVQIWRYEGMSVAVCAVTLLMLGEFVLQLAAGLAIAWQWRARRMIGLAYLLCAAAFVIAGFVFMEGEGIGLRYRVVMMLEGVGSPLLVLIAPRWFGVTKVTRATALGGLLLLAGVSTWVGQSLIALSQVHLMLQVHATAGSWLAEALRIAIALVTGTLAFLAGLRMVRGQPARRMLAAYVIVAIGSQLTLTVLGLILQMIDDSRYLTFTLANTVVTAVVGVARPTVIWLFAKRETEPTADVGAALPWIALWFVPQLIARGLMIEELQTLLPRLAIPIVVLCGACAVVNLGAARAALRGDGARGWWTAAVGFAFAMLAVTIYALQTLDRGSYGAYMGAASALGPVGLLFAATATAAWLARRLTSDR